MAFSRWLVLSALAVVAILAVGPCGRGSGAPDVAVPSWARVAPEQIAEAAKYGVRVAFENSLGMRFILVPRGEFVLGADESVLSGLRDEGPRHLLRIPRPFCIGVTEVTNDQYREYDREHDSGTWRGWTLNEGGQPVVNVTWEEAVAFANWLSAHDERRTYRLPTEAEWEYCCRAGSRTRFWWGDGEAEAGRFANVADGTIADGWSGEPVFDTNDGQVVSARVGQYAASPWGLCDMLGNVWEWCADEYGPYAGASTTDPLAPEAGGGLRVYRGGSWHEGPDAVRCANREAALPGERTPNVGFRLVIVPR